MSEEKSNVLGHLAAEAREKGEVTEKWYFLKNVYFRGEDGIEQLKRWAAENQLQVRFGSEPEGESGRRVQTVTLVPNSPTK